MPKLIRRFLNDQGGATAIEYGIIAGMIFLAIVGSLSLFAGNSTSGFKGAMTTIADKLG